MEAGGNLRGQNPWEWGETMGAARPSEWTPSPTEWGGRRGGARSLEWRKSPGWVGATEWTGELIRLRDPTPPEWQRSPGETKPREPSQRPRTDRGRTDGGGGEGKKTNPPPEQPGVKDPTAETVRHAPDERRRQVRRWRRWWETAARGPGQNTLTAQTAPGPKTACTRAGSTTMWHRRQRREVRSAQGPPAKRKAMGPQRPERDREGRRRGTETPSARSQRRSPTEVRRRRAPPPEQSRALNASGR